MHEVEFERLIKFIEKMWRGDAEKYMREKGHSISVVYCPAGEKYMRENGHSISSCSIVATLEMEAMAQLTGASSM